MVAVDWFMVFLTLGKIVKEERPNERKVEAMIGLNCLAKFSCHVTASKPVNFQSTHDRPHRAIICE